MSLFPTSGVDYKYDSWMNPPDQHEECGCFDICHQAHIEDGLFGRYCEFCADEKCEFCFGFGVTGDDEECKPCKGKGRI